MPGKADLAGDLRLARRSVLVEVNAHIRVAAERLAQASSVSSVWEFMCECGAADCRAYVRLTLAQYDAFALHDRRILADGHGDRSRPPALRPKDRVLARGRPAVFVKLWGDGAVVRFDDEPLAPKVVPLGQLRPLADTERAEAP